LSLFFPTTTTPAAAPPTVRLLVVVILIVSAPASHDAANAAAVFAASAVVGPGRHIVGIAMAMALHFGGVPNNAPSPATTQATDTIGTFVGRDNIGTSPLPPHSKELD
jgi:hypothetical protein